MAVDFNNKGYGHVYISSKGLDKITNNIYIGDEKLKYIKQIAQNKDNAIENDFIVDENGNFNIRNEDYGTFTTCNPPRPQVDGNRFSCDIIDSENKTQSRLSLYMKDKASAEALKSHFGGGTSVPGGVVTLYNALEATAAYQKEQQARMAAERMNARDEIFSMPNLDITE